MEHYAVESSRGTPLLIVESGAFNKCKLLKSGETYWRCTMRMCKAKVFTKGTKNIITRSHLVHCHDKDVGKLKRKIISNIAKRKAVDKPSELPSDVIQSLLKNRNSDDYHSLSAKDIHCIRKNIYNTRKKYSKVKNSFKEVVSSGLPIEQIHVEDASYDEVPDSSVKNILPEYEDPTSLPMQKRPRFAPPEDVKPYCRLCLNPTTKNEMVYLGDLYDPNYSNEERNNTTKILQTEISLRMIKMLMPNLDHGLVYNPVMCYNCSSRLQLAADFIDQCMATQQLIQQYKDTYCPMKKMVSCEEVNQYKSEISVSPVPQNSASTSAIAPIPFETIACPEYIHVPDFVNVKTENIEELEDEAKYEITNEEISIKQEQLPVEENYSTKRISTNSFVVKTEPYSTETSRSNATTESKEINPTTNTQSVVSESNYFAGLPLQPFPNAPVQSHKPVKLEKFDDVINSMTSFSSSSSVNYTPLRYQNNAKS